MPTSRADSPEVIRPASNASARVKATRLRAKIREGTPLTESEQIWMADYEAAQTPRGASRSHKVHMTEETVEAVGTGDAANAAASAVAEASIVREEGRRLDYLATVGMRALEMVFVQQHQTIEQLRADHSDMRKIQGDLLETVRTQFLARTQAEIDLMQAQADAVRDEKKDSTTEMVEQLLPVLLAKLMESGAIKK